MKLEEIARIYRYGRHRDPAYEDERPDRRLVWNEVGPSDLDPLTGFIMPETLSTVVLPKYPDNFRLELYDTVLVFVGARDSLGRVGLVIDREILAIPGRTLCIIRPMDQWKLALHWRLRQDCVRREMLKLMRPADKRGKMTIPIPALRGLDMGSEEEYFHTSEKAIHEQAEGIIEEYRQSRERIAGMMRQIDEDWFT